MSASLSKTLHVERRERGTHEEWIGWHRGLVTGSTVGAVLHVHPFLTAAEVWASLSGIELPQKKSVLLERGLEYESFIIGLIRRDRPDLEITAGTDFLLDAKLGIGCTIDARVRTKDGRRGVLEIKTVAGREHDEHWFEEDGRPKVPPHIVAQVMLQGLLDDADFLMVGAFVIGDYRWERPHLYDVPIDEAAMRGMLGAIANIHEHVRTGKQPQFDFARDGALIKQIFKKSVPDLAIDLRGDNEAHELVDTLEIAKRDLKQIEDRIEAISNQLRVKLGEAERGIVSDDVAVTNKATHVDAYVMNVPEKNYRTLRISRRRKKAAA